ncbi:UDP-glucose dehydrogenase family protein [Actinoalloteichus caeruleus]|uniref:UDP-glucose dehydrogenase family protein n=3 Tax=Actinoalloteichus cyanogriseus TaxID=2893586 RepID=UPI00068A6643|nr:UDP-glucose/GDP-mannose dehydrogenase family protein [Actinoalloteichus caeruleus]
MTRTSPPPDDQGQPPRITVIGAGYLGATHAACMAALGFQVLGVDVDSERVDRLGRGEVPFHEPGLPELLSTQVAEGRLRFTTSLALAAEFGDTHFVCVGTPELPRGYGADLSQVVTVIEMLGPLLTRPCLVVGKSTVPVGTAEPLARRLAELSPVGEHARLAWNPEFLREGHGIQDTLRPDRLVFGVTDDVAERALRRVYAPLLADTPERPATPVVVCDLPTAELVKVAANAYLATRLSFVNLVADVCEASGADVVPLTRALGLDPRIGDRFLGAGLGYGGGCLPKDLRAFTARAEQLGAGRGVELLQAVDQINVERRSRTVALVREELGGEVTDARVAVLGAAFKPHSDDVRDSPALTVAADLHLHGARVAVHDPHALTNARRELPTVDYADSAYEAATGADIVLHLTEWPEYAALDPDRLRRLVRRPTLLDARNTLDRDHWTRAGWSVRSLGRPRHPGSPTPGSLQHRRAIGTGHHGGAGSPTVRGAARET